MNSLYTLRLQKFLLLFGREDSGKFVKCSNYEQQNPVFAPPPAPASKRTNKRSVKYELFRKGNAEMNKMQTAVFGGQQGRLFRPCRAAISGQYSENHQQGEALPAVRLLL